MNGAIKISDIPVEKHTEHPLTSTLFVKKKAASQCGNVRANANKNGILGFL